jgi:hypothetical protein
MFSSSMTSTLILQRMAYSLSELQAQNRTRFNCTEIKMTSLVSLAFSRWLGQARAVISGILNRAYLNASTTLRDQNVGGGGSVAETKHSFVTYI